MIYARVHGQTVAAECHAAMARIERTPELAPTAYCHHIPLGDDPREQLAGLVAGLDSPDLTTEACQHLVSQIRVILDGR